VSVVVPVLRDDGTVDESDHAVSTGEAHGDQHRDEVHEKAQHRDEDLDEILQNMRIPIQSDPPPGTEYT
jgi:hypothetical protein